MPTPGALIPIQRVPSGLPGPGGTGFSPFAHGDAGGDHHGFAPLTLIWKRPRGVRCTLWPVATAASRTDVPAGTVNALATAVSAATVVPSRSGVTMIVVFSSLSTTGRENQPSTASTAASCVSPPTATPPTVTPWARTTGGGG